MLSFGIIRGIELMFRLYYGLYLFQEKLSTRNGDADSMECFVCFETINTQELSVHIDQHNPYNATKVSFPLN